MSKTKLILLNILFFVISFFIGRIFPLNKTINTSENNSEIKKNNLNRDRTIATSIKTNNIKSKNNNSSKMTKEIRLKLKAEHEFKLNIIKSKFPKNQIGMNLKKSLYLLHSSTPNKSGEKLQKFIDELNINPSESFSTISKAIDDNRDKHDYEIQTLIHLASKINVPSSEKQNLFIQESSRSLMRNGKEYMAPIVALEYLYRNGPIEQTREAIKTQLRNSPKGHRSFIYNKMGSISEDLVDGIKP